MTDPPKSEPPMAYHVELDVDMWGALGGDEDKVPDEIPDWSVPYPPLGVVLRLTWDKGSARRRPNIFWYPLLRNWVCDEPAYEFFVRMVPDDIHVIAQATVDGMRAWVVQVVGQLDGVVDEAASLRTSSYRTMDWPSFRYSAADRMAARLFGVPEMYLDVFMGSHVKDALDAAELTGLRLNSVDWTNDLPWSADSTTNADEVWQRGLELATSRNPWPVGIPAGLYHLSILLRIQESMRVHGLLTTVARTSPDDLSAAPAAARYFDLPELEAVLHSVPQWTKATLDEIEARFREFTTGEALRSAVARRHAASPGDF
jgi:hypothetical protein